MDSDRMAFCSTTERTRNLWSVGGQSLLLVRRWLWAGAISKHHNRAVGSLQPACLSALFQMIMLTRFARVPREGKPHYVSSFQVWACVSLVKEMYLVNPRITVGVGYYMDTQKAEQTGTVTQSIHVSSSLRLVGVGRQEGMVLLHSYTHTLHTCMSGISFRFRSSGKCQTPMKSCHNASARRSNIMDTNL